MKLFLKKLKKALTNPKLALLVLLNSELIAHFFPDSIYLKMKYRLFMGKKLNLKNPQSFNEKLQWLKLHDRRPEYTKMVDKYEVRKHIAETIGEEYLIPLLGVWDNPDDIDFDKLPDQFVLKCTHNSGLGMCICNDKSKLDIEKVKKELKKGLKQNYFITSREWPYKNVKPRIIAEKYMVDESGIELKDYKIFCFNGTAEYVEVDFNRHIEHKLNPYDFEWNPLNFCDSSKNDYAADIRKPEKIEEMRKIAEELAKNVTYLRVDFYSIYSKIYVGELTFYPGSGFIQFDPMSTDMKYGTMLNLEGIEKS